MTRIFYLIFILLVGCSEPGKDLVVKLNSQDGYGVFMPGNGIIWPSSDSIIYRNVPKGIEEYVVRNLPLQPTQYHWNKYLEGSIEKPRFEEFAEYFSIDSTQLTNQIVDCEVLFLVGTKSGKRVIIVDSDNDEDFENERILEYEYPLTIERQKEIENTLPVVLVQYEYYENGQILTRKTNIKPSPYKLSLELSFNTDNQTEKKYFLFVSFPEYKKGSIDINGLNYNIFVSNGFSQSYYSANRLSVFINQKSDSLPSELNGDIPYEIGDVFNVNGNDYLIDSITNWGDELFIKYLGENSMPVGIIEGFYMPKFKAKHLDNSTFELNQHPDKYILLDFWGTWCRPCIQLIPELKSLNEEFNSNKFVLVSVAHDRDPEKVKDFITKEKMNWEHVFISQVYEDKNSLTKKLKINRYPTTILISPDGKIVARDKTIDELKEILRSVL